MEEETTSKTLYFAKRFHNINETDFWNTLKIANNLEIFDEKQDNKIKKINNQIMEFDTVELKTNANLIEIISDLDFNESKVILARPAVFYYNNAYNHAIFLKNYFKDFQDSLTEVNPVLAIINQKQIREKQPSLEKIESFEKNIFLFNPTPNLEEVEEIANVFINLDKTFDVLDKQGFKYDKEFRKDFDKQRDTYLAIIDPLFGFKISDKNTRAEELQKAKKDLILHTKVSYFTQ